MVGSQRHERGQSFDTPWHVAASLRAVSIRMTQVAATPSRFYPLPSRSCPFLQDAACSTSFEKHAHQRHDGAMPYAMLSSALILAASSSTSTPHPLWQGCDVPQVQSVADLHTVLSLRAVQAVTLAAHAGQHADAILAHLISPMAEISLGSGDVGRPLGTGVKAMRKLAQDMQADSYRFLNWDYIPMPVKDACGPYEVKVEFTNSRSRHVFPVTFAFQAGRIVSAQGWSRSFQSGAIGPNTLPNTP